MKDLAGACPIERRIQAGTPGVGSSVTMFPAQAKADQAVKQKIEIVLCASSHSEVNHFKKETTPTPRPTFFFKLRVLAFINKVEVGEASVSVIATDVQHAIGLLSEKVEFIPVRHIITHDPVSADEFIVLSAEKIDVVEVS